LLQGQTDLSRVAWKGFYFFIGCSLYIRPMTGTERWARPMALIEKWEPFAPGLMALIVGIFYFLTMSPTIGHTDSGELDAVAYTFGVAHPTGYPLFTLLGWLFTRLPLGTVAWRMNLMCLLFVVGSAWVWAKFLREFFILMRTSVKKGDSSYALRIKVANLAGTIVGTLMLCFGRTWWMQSTSSEVYSLQCLLLALMLWTLLKAWHSKEKVFKAWAIFAVVLALCFTNHLTSIVFCAIRVQGRRFQTRIWPRRHWTWCIGRLLWYADVRCIFASSLQLGKSGRLAEALASHQGKTVQCVHVQWPQGLWRKFCCLPQPPAQ
jgi:hypothetical protein